jgi:quercetin dioxygenase-like cupin family protein
MRLRSLAAIALAAFAFTTTAQAQDSASFPPANGGTSVSNPASHYSFSDTGARGVNPKTGIQVANVWGNVTKGAHGAFFRFDPGFVSPLHTHTYDYYAVVIKGDLENYQPGQKPEKLGPGSYWYQRGKQAHTTACVSEQPCEIYIVQQNKFDAQIPPKTE